MGLMGILSPRSAQREFAAGLSVNINFYLLLDIRRHEHRRDHGRHPENGNQYPARAPRRCHETNPSADNLGNPNGEDN